MLVSLKHLLILEIVPKVSSEFLFGLSFYSYLSTLSCVHVYVHAIVGFHQFSKSKAAFGTTLGVTGGYLKAGTSFLKRVAGRMFRISQ